MIQIFKYTIIFQTSTKCTPYIMNLSLVMVIKFKTFKLIFDDIFVTEMIEIYLSHDMTRQNVSSGVSDLVRHKLACSATEACMNLEILVTETRVITLSRQWTTKALIRLRGCSGWSAPLLFASDIRHVFHAPAHFILTQHIDIGNGEEPCFVLQQCTGGRY